MQQLNIMDEQTLRRYLLGDMTVEEQEGVEQWLMSEDDAYDLIEAAEDDLIDDSLNGKLKGRELTQFNAHFLIAPERQKKLRFSRSLNRFINTSPVQNTVPFWTALADALTLRAPLVWAASAVMAVLVIGVWSFQRDADLQRRLDSAAGELTGIQQQRDELQRQLKTNQAANEDLQKQVRTLEETLARTPSRPASPTLLAVNLIPSLTRTSTNIPSVDLTAGANVVQFSLALLDDNYATYRVSLRNADGKELFVRDRLMSSATAGGKSIVFVVQSSLLSPADYTIVLAGVSDPATPENIGTFPFRAVRR